MAGTGVRRAPARGLQRTPIRLTGAVAVIVMVVAGLPVVASGSSFASAPSPLTVTVTADPSSGGEVHPGDSISYTLSAVSPGPFPDGARVVDDLSGLLDHARVLSTDNELADAGLTLDQQAETMIWDVPAVTGQGTAGSPVTAAFRVTVVDTAPAGTQLITGAAPAGGTCGAGDPCGTILTVTRPPAAPPTPDPGGSPESSAPQTPTSVPETAHATDRGEPAADAHGGVHRGSRANQRRGAHDYHRGRTDADDRAGHHHRHGHRAPARDHGTGDGQPRVHADRAHQYRRRSHIGGERSGFK